VTQTYLNHQATTVLFASREASAAGRLCSNGVLGREETPADYSTTTVEYTKS
jgi:hypothetical protein